MTTEKEIEKKIRNNIKSIISMELNRQRTEIYEDYKKAKNKALQQERERIIIIYYQLKDKSKKIEEDKKIGLGLKFWNLIEELKEKSK